MEEDRLGLMSHQEGRDEWMNEMNGSPGKLNPQSVHVPIPSKLSVNLSLNSQHSNLSTKWSILCSWRRNSSGLSRTTETTTTTTTTSENRIEAKLLMGRAVFRLPTFGIVLNVFGDHFDLIWFGANVIHSFQPVNIENQKSVLNDWRGDNKS